MGLYLDVQPGEWITIGANTRITVEEKTGRRTRLRIDSSDGMIKLHKEADASKTPAEPEAPTLRRPMLKLPLRE